MGCRGITPSIDCNNGVRISLEECFVLGLTIHVGGENLVSDIIGGGFSPDRLISLVVPCLSLLPIVASSFGDFLVAVHRTWEVKVVAMTEEHVAW